MHGVGGNVAVVPKQPSVKILLNKALERAVAVLLGATIKALVYFESFEEKRN